MRSAIVKRLQPAEEDSGDEHAGEHSTDRRHSVPATRHRRHARRPGTESGGSESDSENHTAHQLRQNVSLRHVEPRDVQKSNPPQPENPEHGRDDRREHDLEHGEVGEIELPDQLPSASHSAALEAPAERDADDERDEETEPSTEQSVLEEWRAHFQAHRSSGATA